MKQRLLTPGPSPVPEETLLELAKPVFYHRSAQFRQLLGEVLEDLQYVYCTRNTIALLTASGTGGMEAAVANCLTPGSKAIVAVAGKFGERWRSIAQAFGVEVVSVTVPYGQSVQPEQIEQALKQHPDAAAVCATLSETSTGARHDIQALGNIVAPTNALCLVDGISGVGVAECRTDDWHIDVCVAASQKTLLLPPGLAFLSISDKAWQRIERNSPSHVFYFDLRKYRDNLKNNDTPFTPAHLLVRALRVSLKQLRAEGIENTWTRHARMAAACRAGVRALGLELFAAQPADGVTVVKTPEGIDGVALVSKLENLYGIRIAGGQDLLEGKIFRIAHVGYVDQFDVLAALSALEMVLLEMGHVLKPGSGVAAVQQVLTQSVRMPRMV
jgi:aspartate aminotransferase-like enzyme